MTPFLCYQLGTGNPLQSFKLASVELQVKELQKADVKACCLHDESKYEKQSSWKANTVLHMGHLKLHEVDFAKTTN